MSDENEGQQVTEEPVDTEVETEAEELIVTIGDEATEDEGEAETEGDEAGEGAEQGTKVIRMLRRKADEAKRVHAELRDTKRKLAELEAAQIKAPAKIELGAKPTLAGHDYDAAKFEQALDDWKETKRKVDAQEAETRAAQDAAEREWTGKIDAFNAAKKGLKVRDYEDAEATAKEMFSVVQQGIILQGSDNPALMVYALGKNPEEAKKIAAIKDPVQFAFAVAKMEATKLKATPRPAPPTPEKVITGTAGVSTLGAKRMDKLLEEARKTGDYTALRAAKKAAS
jgi:hypothetical protein